MHHRYFPRCPIDGPIDPPIPFAHLSSSGAVPNKCGNCEHLFEGECTRYIEDVGHYLHLDHGPCGIDGPTDPIFYEDEFVRSKVEIPRKCANCHFLGTDSLRGFYCQNNAEKWGDIHRGLDWGAWEPDGIYLELPPPKVTTRELSRFAQRNDEMSFIKEHRRINPGLSIQDAKADFARFRDILKRHESSES